MRLTKKKLKSKSREELIEMLVGYARANDSLVSKLFKASDKIERARELLRKVDEEDLVIT